MTNKELKKVLELHKKWLNNEKGGVRANLQGADMRGADMRDAIMRYADMQGADMQGADMRGADMRDAIMRYADMRDAIMRYADMQGADMQGADMRGADMRDAIMRYADMRDAIMRYADMRDAIMRYANMQGADMQGADMRDANMQGAIIRGAKNIPFIPLVCPERGEFVAFKKYSGYIIELLIPADAKRCSATTRKCRASYAKVLSITTLTGEHVNTDSVANTAYSPNIVYKVGEFVYPDEFDDDRWNECSHGIHFFINRQEAVEY